ncbi:AlbA family DNA-binding domain-containing protein [Streptomyces bottropensis]|uniref:AlbA family DNA-binding domain-containing protein n=1 Tax=Streptomyces bottropensis TaxID=42235 RepID=UPI0036AE19EC
MAAEGRDLDHKLAPHDTGTEGGGEPAQAIAAFANSTGGVLVLGLQDDRRTSIPLHPSPIQLTDGPRRRYSEPLASRTAPNLDVDIHFAKETHTSDGQVPNHCVGGQPPRNGFQRTDTGILTATASALVGLGAWRLARCDINT